MDLTNILVAGGAVRSILTDKSIKDIDLFIYGISSSDVAQKRVEKLILDIKKHMESIKSGDYLKKQIKVIRESINDKDQADKYVNELERLNRHLSNKHQNTDVTIYNNGNTITMMAGCMQIQVILRLYNTKSEILHGFDLGSSAVGYDGTNVLFTSLSKFSYENRVNVFDHTRRSTTYEQRLVKYLDHGFDMVLPDFNIDKLNTKYHKYNLKEVCELPYVTFSYGRIKGNMIYVDTFFNKFNQEMSDYSFYESLDGDDDESGAFGLLYHNIKEIISGRNNIVYRMKLSKELEVYDSLDDARNKWKLNFSGKIFNWGSVDHVYNNLQSNLNSSSIRLDDLKKYFNVFGNLKDFVDDLYLSDRTFEEKQKMLDKLVADQIKSLNKSVTELEASSLNWITKNPTTQLTSSINPILKDANEWYGDLYIDKTSNVNGENKKAKKVKGGKKVQSAPKEDTKLNDLPFKQVLNVDEMIEQIQYTQNLNDKPSKAPMSKLSKKVIADSEEDEEDEEYCDDCGNTVEECEC